MTPAEAYRLFPLLATAYALEGMSAPRNVAMPAGFIQVDYLTANDFGKGPSNFGLIAQETATGKLIRAIRGSVTVWDWDEDFRFVQVTAPDGIGKMEAGFAAVTLSIRTGSGRPMPRCDQSIAHSLGGPVESRFAALDGADTVFVASPEPGSADYALWVAKSCSAVLNLQNPHDVVPDAPGRWLGYRDVGVITPVPMPWVNPLDVPANHSSENYEKALGMMIGAIPAGTAAPSA